MVSAGKTTRETIRQMVSGPGRGHLRGVGRREEGGGKREEGRGEGGGRREEGTAVSLRFSVSCVWKPLNRKGFLFSYTCPI